MPNDAIGRMSRDLTRSRARSFYLASLFLPRTVRRDVHVVYAYYRTVDDLVDEPPLGWSRDQVARELDWWRDGVLGRHDEGHPLLSELLVVSRRYGIPPEYLVMVLDGAYQDLECRTPQTMDDLIEYSVLVAGSVGMVMTHVLGTAENNAVEAARHLGVAMQLTNILRDVAEDLDRGRIYLPREVMEGANCPPLALHSRIVCPELCAVLEVVAGEARRRYALGEAGIPLLPPSVRFSIALAATLYARILDKIERQNFDVFAGRAHVGTVEKWAMAMPVYLQHRYVFRR